ncbi:hypothetical protein KCU65_g6905, partial [Aureobasidium melanogenum]
MMFSNPRYKFPVHVIYVVLVALAMGLSVPRLFMKSQPRTRANTIALGMGAKSLMFIAYQLLTEHVARFRRWRSYKAFFILNSLEIVFWAAVAFLVIQANLSRCIGTSCILSWVVAALGIVLSLTAVCTAILSWLEYQHSRRQRNVTVGRRVDPITRECSDVEMVKA